MKGKLFKRSGDKVWMVKYNDPSVTEHPIPIRELPIYHKNLTISQKWSLEVGMVVEFEIIDEFTHPELYEGVPLFEGITLAKLIFN